MPKSSETRRRRYPRAVSAAADAMSCPFRLAAVSLIVRRVRRRRQFRRTDNDKFAFEFFQRVFSQFFHKTVGE